MRNIMNILLYISLFDSGDKKQIGIFEKNAEHFFEGKTAPYRKKQPHIFENETSSLIDYFFYTICFFRLNTAHHNIHDVF